MSGARFVTSITAVLASAALVVSGCGSSKPAFCTTLSQLQTSIKDLNVNEGVSGLKSQAQTIENQALSLVSSARSDFPTETSAIRNAVNGLKNSVSTVKSSPSASQVAGVASDASTLVSAIDSFATSAKSKCS